MLNQTLSVASTGGKPVVKAARSVPMSCLIVSKDFRTVVWDGDLEGYASGIYRCQPEEGKGLWEAVKSGELRIKFTPPPGKRVRGGRGWFSVWKDHFSAVREPTEAEWAMARAEERVEFPTTNEEGYEDVGFERYWIGTSIDGEEMVCRETVYPR
jgi:hypothetical protein